jgi:hypothetical protein
MRESIEIEKHNTIDQEGKPLDSIWCALLQMPHSLHYHQIEQTPSLAKIHS